MNALEYELNKVKNRYADALKRLRGYADYKKIDYREIIRRLLTSRSINDAAGNLNPYGYDRQLCIDSPLGHMEFLVFFIGHELLGDGDPGLGWHKYNLDTGEMEMCDPPKCLEPNSRRYDSDDPNWNAKPFWHCCHEILPPGSKRLYEEEVLWVLDWHEKARKAWYDDEVLNRYDEKLEPPDPMLVALADEIVGCDNE